MKLSDLIFKSIEIHKNRARLDYLTNYRNELKDEYKLLINSKAFRVWQNINLLKKIVNPKSFLSKIKNKILSYTSRFKLILFPNINYDNAGFIFLTKETKFWNFDGFEQVGTDWHIRIRRKVDNKVFLLDQQFFYCLQLKINKPSFKEIFITYGISQDRFLMIKQILGRVGLC